MIKKVKDLNIVAESVPQYYQVQSILKNKINDYEFCQKFFENIKFHLSWLLKWLNICLKNMFVKKMGLGKESPCANSDQSRLEIFKSKNED